MIEHYGCTMCKFFGTDRVDRIDRNSPCYDCEGAHTRSVLKDNFVPMTNADRIRRMNDEKLAEFLNNVASNCEKITACERGCDKCVNDNEVCQKFVELWLQEEVSEDDSQRIKYAADGAEQDSLMPAT